MLVEFTRVATAQDYNETGEDDGMEPAVGRELRIGIEPREVAAAFESTETGVVIIRLRDGRGFKVKGDYTEVSEKLAGRRSATEGEQAA